MNKSELVEAVCKSTGLARRDAEGAVNAVVETVIAAVKKNDRVAIVGFGSFTQTSRKARVGRNPQTGAPVKIAASKGVRFGPSLNFKAAVNGKAAAKKAAPAKKAPAKKAPAKKAAPAKKR